MLSAKCRARAQVFATSKKRVLIVVEAWWRDWSRARKCCKKNRFSVDRVGGGWPSCEATKLADIGEFEFLSAEVVLFAMNDAVSKESCSSLKMIAVMIVLCMPIIVHPHLFWRASTFSALNVSSCVCRKPATRRMQLIFSYLSTISLQC